MITFITPIFYKNKYSYIYKRAKLLIKNFSTLNNIELIIADSSKKPILNSSFKNIKIIHTYTKDKAFSPAKARNQAVSKASHKLIFFYDVDLFFNFELIKKLLFLGNEILQNKKNFIALPFLYLTKKGSHFLISTNNTTALKQSFLKGENHLIESFAANGSAILLKKEIFLKLGGFKENFLGHGGEDFDFLHRLFAHYPHSAQNTDYYFNQTSQFVANLKGFRNYMARYSLPYFFDNLFLLHLWHPRPFSNPFYFRKESNKILLLESMQNFDKCNTNIWASTKKLPSIEDFILQLAQEHGYSKDQCIGFFSYGKGIKPPKKPLGNKLRKLFLNPKSFLQDSKIFKFHKRLP
ncbi:glycosyltransferase [Helicobacter burdigaliensis]|uniref:glycosyltransferase n=1 Tax=Helicobacter burdigaliensis TaxID=2315334 RepID=UPI000EF74873|nr:glycosyltransferase [Helicobacter burdigaliensis]